MEEIEYPCLMESGGVVVCFSSYGVGHVVSADNQSAFYTGYLSKYWVMGNFKPYEAPKEPVYEYLVVYGFGNKNYISTDFLTEEEAKGHYRDMFVELAEWSKRERK